MSVHHTYDPARLPLRLTNPRLEHLLHNEPQRCATIAEYAQQIPCAPEEVIALLGAHLDDRTLALEFISDQVFVHTAPHGRPAPSGCADVAPNLWEHLRERNNPETAYALWKLVRALQRAGWAHVEANSRRVAQSLAPMANPPSVGIQAMGQMIPVLAYPALDGLAAHDGLLTAYDHAGATRVAVACAHGTLDVNATAARSWLLARRSIGTELSVLLLEAPQYQPTLLAATDGAVQALSSADLDLGADAWRAPEVERFGHR